MFLKSNYLTAIHGFATRRGGVSHLPHTSALNLAFGRGDGDETVLENLALFATAVGFDETGIVSRPQIHSDIICRVGKSNMGEGYFIREGIPSCDGYITNEPAVTLGIKTADCVPILFEAKREGKVIAVGAVHAGWRGTVSGIAPKCVRLLCEEYGVLPREIAVAIGPCIGQCCYEVGEEVYLAAAAQAGKETADRFFIPKTEKIGKFMCDLGGLNRTLLETVGLPRENIDLLGLCTACHPTLFYSHRASGGVRGTMLSVISMP